MKSLPSSLKSKREGNASWVGSATSQFRNTLHLIWHRYVSVYGIHSELGFTVFSLFLKQLSFQILVNALCYKDGGFFFFFLKPLVLELAYFCLANMHGPTEFSSVRDLQVLLQHLITWGAEVSSTAQADVLQETNLQGVLQSIQILLTVAFLC